MFALIEKAEILRLPTDIVLELLETCVVPVLLYGAEISPRAGKALTILKFSTGIY